MGLRYGNRGDGCARASANESQHGDEATAQHVQLEALLDAMSRDVIIAEA